MRNTTSKHRIIMRKMISDNLELLDTMWYASRSIPTNNCVEKYVQAGAVLCYDHITNQFKAYLWVWGKMDEFEDAKYIAQMWNKINKKTALAIFWNYIMVELGRELEDNYAY